MSQIDVSQVVLEIMMPFTEGNETIGGISSMRFDAGTGSSYYIVAPVIDSGNELRSKVIKSARVTGRRTNVSMEIYGYDVRTPISIEDLESGDNSSTGAIAVTDSTGVAQSPRVQVNVPNSVLSTIRVEGDDTGNEERDQIHEITYEQADQGVRR